MEKIKALAIERRASSSFIITSIILGYFNIENNNEQPIDCSKIIEIRQTIPA